MIDQSDTFYGLNVTFNTTEDCNLACKYCYEINKRKKDLDLDKAYKFIDLLCETEDIIDQNAEEGDRDFSFMETGIILDFIGGDSLMNVEVVRKIIEYFTYKVYTSDTPNCRNWRKAFRCSLSSNGTLFEKPAVQKFMIDFGPIMSIGISIDGCKEIHDKNRIFAQRGPNGEEIGSMDTIMKGKDFHRKVCFSDSLVTKATCAKDSIPYLYQSLKFMHEELGLISINQNFIMEDMHLEDNDYRLLDEQMEKCVRYVLDKHNDLYWSMIDKNFFANHGKHDPEGAKCGSGCMPCLGINGKIYPCFRWAPHTQTEKTVDQMVVGDIWNGFNHKENFARVREGSKYKNCSKEQRCHECEFSSACSYCIGGCYAEYGDFVRTTHICEVTKIQCKWAKVYWNEYNKLVGKPLEYPKKYQLGKVPKWTPKYKGTNKGI